MDESEKQNMVGLMTAAELASALAVSPETIKVWARQGIIPAVKITRRIVRFDWQSVLHELAKRQTGVEVCPTAKSRNVDRGAPL